MSQKVEESNNQKRKQKYQQEFDIEILMQIRKKKEENQALKKMLDNLNQLQKLNKSKKRKK